MPGHGRSQRGRGRLGTLAAALGRAYRWVVVTGRWGVVAAWIAGAVLVTMFVPNGGGGGGDFGDLLPANSPVLQVERQILDQFEVPLLSGTTVVIRQQGGLSVLTRADAALWALATTKAYQQGEVPAGPGHIIAAVPVPTNAPDTTVTYIYTSAGTGRPTEVRLAQQYASHFSNQASVSTYVTGFIPAQVGQTRYLNLRLSLFEIATVILILLVVGIAFRSLVAPFVVVGVAAIGYLIYFPLLTTLAGAFNFTVPSQLEPVLVALLLGVVTDYCVLFFDSFRDELATGEERRDAARSAVRRNGSIVAVAGLTVAGGTIALVAAPFGIFRALGPALALTVLVGVAVCLTLTPALMTLLGHRLFTFTPEQNPVGRGADAAARRRSRRADRRGKPAQDPLASHRLVRVLTVKPVAAAALVVVVAALGVAALPVAKARLDLSFTSALPPADSVAEGARLLGEAGLRGVTAPTEVLLQQGGVTGNRAALARLQGALAGQPGVALVLGPASSPLSEPRGIVLARDTNSARFVVVYDTDPLAATAITHVRQLQGRLPGLAVDAGLPRARVAVTGQTVIASQVARLTRESLTVTLLVALAVELVILIVYLRAVVAPVALLIGSALSVAASLGLTTWLFQDVLGEAGLTFYAPFAAAVLLLALGSDYNVFSVGTIWEEAAGRTLRGALLVAVPRSFKAITTAGIILSATFALVAIIPLTTFRQIAFAVSAGLLIDTLIVRPVLTPATLVLLGRVAGWPSHRIRTRESDVAIPDGDTGEGPVVPAATGGGRGR